VLEILEKLAGNGIRLGDIEGWGESISFEEVESIYEKREWIVSKTEGFGGLAQLGRCLYSIFT